MSYPRYIVTAQGSSYARGPRRIGSSLYLGYAEHLAKSARETVRPTTHITISRLRADGKIEGTKRYAAGANRKEVLENVRNAKWLYIDPSATYKGSCLEFDPYTGVTE